jgi:arylsulfatase A-like enzyme
MTSRSESSTADPPPSTAPGATGDPRHERPSPWTLLLVSVWVGLTAGFLDLGFMILKKHLIDGGGFYHLGVGFPWIIPAGVAGLVLLPGAALALVARLRATRLPLALAVALLSFVAALNLCALLPLEAWSSLLLSGGVAVQAARLVRRRPGGFLRCVRLTCPVLAGAVVLLAAATSGLRAWSEYRAAATLPPPPSAPRNVLLVVWDTVRARNLSLYGHGRKTTPNLERLAARGVHFRHAFATASWTLPSHASLFTGRWPHELSVGWKTALDDTQPTIADRLRSLGYDTAGFIANLDYCGHETGLARGFTHYEDYPLTAWEVFSRYIGLGRRIDQITLAMIADILSGGRLGGARPIIPLSREHAKGAADIDRSFLDWLAWQRPRRRPFFAFLNFNDAHTPYKVPDDGAEGFGIRPSKWHERLVLHQWNTLDKTTLPFHDVQMANDLYDDAIAYMDRRLGILLDELDRRGVLDETLVIVTSDHGEHLGDHLLFFHGCSLYRQAVEVPLVIVDPRLVPPGHVVDAPVSLREVPATIVGLLGLDQAAAFPGQSLARFWAEGERAPPASEPLLMETDKPNLLTNQGREPAAKGPMKAVIAGGMHYIRSGDGSEELYSLAQDPEERSNVAGLAAAGQSLEGFRAALRSMLRRRPSGDGRTASLFGGDRATGPP